MSTRATNRVQNILNPAIGVERPGQIVNSSMWVVDAPVGKKSRLSYASADDGELGE